MLPAGTAGLSAFPQGSNNSWLSDLGSFVGDVGNIIDNISPIWSDDVKASQNGQQPDDTYVGPPALPTTGAVGESSGFVIDNKVLLIGGAILLAVLLFRK